MAKKEPTQREMVLDVLNAKRQAMRANCANIGEPAVEIPLSDIQTFEGENGELRAVIGMDKLVYLIDRLLR